MKPSNTDTQEIERAIDAEQASDLAALQLAAGEGQGAPQALAEPEPERSGPSEKSLHVAALIVGIVRPIAGYAMPSLREAPDALWEPIPQGVAGLLDHYDLSEHIDNPWAGLAMACAPLAAFAAMEAIKNKPQEAKPKEPGQLAAPAQVPSETPGQKTVTFGAPAAPVEA